MARKLTKKEARRISGLRKTFKGGRPVVPANCPKCGVECPSTRAALGHMCKKPRVAA